MITTIEDLDPNQRYSYADYLTWQFAERVELLKGLSRELGTSFINFLRRSTCDVFYAPFDVRLYNRQKSLLADQDVYTVVQPDISIICD
nr:Uma2 family endonuclease [Bernardetiaceae bacterium]